MDWHSERSRCRRMGLILALPNVGFLGEGHASCCATWAFAPEPSFNDPGLADNLRLCHQRALGLDLIRVRSLDPSRPSSPLAQPSLGIAGNDVLMEFRLFRDLTAPLDLDVGHCHRAVAATNRRRRPEENVQPHEPCSRRTKYPEITPSSFSARHAACRPGNGIKLNGGGRTRSEPRPLPSHRRSCSDWRTLKANGLDRGIERPSAEVSSRLIVNRPALKTRPSEVGGWIERFPRGRLI